MRSEICLFILLKILLLVLDSVRSDHYVPFYRKDYTFIEDFNAFYKLHWDEHGISWHSAFMACDDEGAKLFYPKVEHEWGVVKNLTGSLKVPPNTTDVYIGIHDEFGLGEFITVDGQTTPSPLSDDNVSFDEGSCVFMDVETGKYKFDVCDQDLDNIKPFVCKKVDDSPCPTIDRAYQYEKEFQKCYKLHVRAKSWLEAMQTCFMEGGMLFSIGCEAEANMLYKKASILDQEYMFTGFRRMIANGEFYTVKDDKLDETGYNKFYSRPNKDRGHCGATFNYGNTLLYQAVDCLSKLPFICEMRPKSN